MLFLSRAGIKKYLLITAYIFFCTTIGVAIDSENECLFEEIKAIKDDNERTVEWLSFLKYLEINAPKHLKKFHDSSKNLWKKRYPLKKVILLSNRATLHYLEGDFEKGINKCLNAIKILETLPYKTIAEQKIECLIYSNISRYAHYAKDEQKDLKYAYKALAISLNTNFTFGRALAYIQLSNILNNTRGEEELSYEYLMKAKDCFPLDKSYHKYITFLTDIYIASHHSNIGNHKKSIQQNQKILDTLLAQQLIGIIPFTYFNLGKTYLKIKNINAAKKSFIRSITILDSIEVSINKGYPLLWLGRTYIASKNIHEVEICINEIELWLKKYQYGDYAEVQYYTLKSNLAKLKKEASKAIFWLEKAIEKKRAIDQNLNLEKVLEYENELQRITLQKKKHTFKTQQETISDKVGNHKTNLFLLLALSTLAAILGYFVFKSKNKNSLIPQMPPPTLKNKNTKNKHAQEKSSQSISDNTLDQEKITYLKDKIIRALKEDRLHLKKGITLRIFANHISSNTTYVSKAINDGFGKNFSALINEYRIKEVLQLFEQEQYKYFTIETIAHKAGFKSKSSFQKAFKKHTGVTASHYLKQTNYAKTITSSNSNGT